MYFVLSTQKAPTLGESAKAIVEDKKATKRARESIKQKKEEAAEKKSEKKAEDESGKKDGDKVRSEVASVEGFISLAKPVTASRRPQDDRGGGT